MTLDEAIQHCREQVQEQAKKGCYSCAEEHQQLAEWLKELKAYKEGDKGMKLLIDIPEHIYEHAKETTEDSRDEFDAMRAIANGTQQESRSEIPTSCGDAISRQAVLDGIEELKKSPWATDKRGIGFEYLITEALEVVEDLCVKREPSVTPQQRTGRWVEYVEPNDAEPLMLWCCENCDTVERRKTTYCPNCGAKMEVEE